MIHRCVSPLVLLLLASFSAADDWPQWQGPQRDGVWREPGILGKFPEGGPKVVWRSEIGGGFTGPAVADGRVYVMDRQGEALAKGAEFPKKGDLPGRERVLCFSAADGKQLWKHEYDCPYRIAYTSGPRATPAVAGGKVYTLGAMGHVHCLDAVKGTVLWTKNLTTAYGTAESPLKPPAWGFASHPLVVGDRLICLAGGEGSAVVALHKDTGKELWKALTVKEIGYAPPMVFEAGGKQQLIVWHTEAVNSLDGETGKVYWSEKFPSKVPVRPGITAATPRLAGDLLFVSSPHHGSLMLRLAADRPAATVVWRGKSDDLIKPDGLHAMMNSPLVHEGHVYGVCVFGELRCLKAETGQRLWEEQTHRGRKAMGPTTFLVRHDEKARGGQRYFLFNDQGELIIAQLSPKGYEGARPGQDHQADAILAGPRGRLVAPGVRPWLHLRAKRRRDCVPVAEGMSADAVSRAAMDALASAQPALLKRPGVGASFFRDIACRGRAAG